MRPADDALSFADRVFLGAVLTADPDRPTAEAVGVRGERIIHVGDRTGSAALIGPHTQVSELGDTVLIPGFVEAHGHPLSEAVFLSPRMVDIRPVVAPSAEQALAILDAAIAAANAAADTAADAGGVYANGWDPLLQVGLPTPTLDWMNERCPDRPFAILHNSGHSAWFNTAAATASGVTRETPDPVGSSFGRDEAGELDGSLQEVGAAELIFGPALAIAPDEFVRLLAAESQRLNAAGITTVGELGFNPLSRAGIDAARAAGALTVRLRLYEMSTAAKTSAARPGDGDDVVRQVGIKLWADGSPWVGSVATSFPYLDTPATRSLGLEPHHHGQANYTAAEIEEISGAYFAAGWQLACHAHGDVAIDMVLDAWERLLLDGARPDHRLRLEHVGAMTREQFERAARLGVTASLFIDHLYYWGDVLVDDLFGDEHGSEWVRAGSALAAGMRISFHNDGQVTPPEPLRNIEIAVTRRSRSGRVLAPAERITAQQALRAHTLDGAYQLFSDHEVGSITVGKLADLVVLGSSPLEPDARTAPAGSIANIPVRETIVGGRTVYVDSSGESA
jgi:predicted amidohydrolase YtcJ